MSKRKVYVYADWNKMANPIIMGVLTSERLRGKEIFQFEYDSNWIKSKYAQMLDPDLQLYTGPQFLSDGAKYNFGLFMDSSPDRWGRLLMRRREAAESRAEGRQENKLFETDYLLGVFDGHRMGGLRFKLDLEGEFLSDNIKSASPPWTSLRELEKISLKLEEEDVINDPDYLKWLNMLVAPGSSLGGARPKASVLDQDNQLWIAKFPSKSDEGDTGLWEMVTHDLAVKAEVSMADAQVIQFTSNHHTFLTKRFDRTTEGKRIHFTSAMTQLGYMDGDDASDGVSYLELVDFITTSGVRVKEDLEELWRRIVFSICVSNTDDHLRNHGFLLTNEGWVLSPAYDINPVETGTGLKLNISENDNALDIGLALEVSEYFRLNKKQANGIVAEIKNVIKDWRLVATKYGISKSNQELKSFAFRQGES